MYVRPNFKSKKALKEAIKNGEKVTIFQPNDMFGNPKASPTFTGNATVEGPHFPDPHRWYGNVKVENGLVVSVK